jgi:hypothetical protein
MIYSIKHAEWQWQIVQANAQSKYTLRYKRPVAWTSCATEFDSAELAADAVINGKTGLSEWDALKHERPMPSLGSWLIDPSAGLGALVPAPVTS